MRPRTFRPRMSRSFCGAFPWGGRPSPPRSPTSSPSWPARTRGSSPGWSFRSTEDCGPAAASHHTDDRPSTRRPRSYERVKRPAKNIYPTRKHDHVRPPSKVSYTLTVTDDSLYQGNTLASIHRRAGARPVSSGEVALVVLGRERVAGLSGLSTVVSARRDGLGWSGHGGAGLVKTAS